MSRIYNILNTLINKVQFKVMSQTIGGENTVEGCLNVLNNRTNTSLTLSSTANNYFTLSTEHGYKSNEIFCYYARLTTKADVPVGEINMGYVSPTPTERSVGIAIRNSNTELCGGVYINETGTLYLNLSSSIISDRQIDIQVIGVR